MRLQVNRSNSVLIFYFIFSIWCWQVFWWRHEAVAVSAYQFKRAIHRLKPQEALDWGALCNALEDYHCSADVFGHLLQRQPQNRTALINFAIAKAQQNECATALVQLDRYRETGAEGAEALYWRGVCAFRMDQLEEARRNFYLSISQSAEVTKAPEDLVRLLFDQGLKVEALSLIGAFTEGQPSRSARWRPLFAELMASPQALDLKPTQIVRIPSLDGQNFWMPVKFQAHETPEFMLLDVEHPDLTLSVQQIKSRQPASDALLNTLQMGPWILENLPYSTCEGCNSVIGRSVLENFEVNESRENQTRFLTLIRN